MSRVCLRIGPRPPRAEARHKPRVRHRGSGAVRRPAAVRAVLLRGLRRGLALGRLPLRGVLRSAGRRARELRSRQRRREVGGGRRAAIPAPAQGPARLGARLGGTVQARLPLPPLGRRGGDQPEGRALGGQGPHALRPFVSSRGTRDHRHEVRAGRRHERGPSGSECRRPPAAAGRWALQPRLAWLGGRKALEAHEGVLERQLEDPLVAAPRLRALRLAERTGAQRQSGMPRT